MSSPLQPARLLKCSATARSTGKQCNRWAIAGGAVCTKHGGQIPHVKARAAVRVAAMNWGPGDTNVDPGEVLLRLITQSYARLEYYAQELDRVVGQSESLKEALVGKIYGEFGEQGEYVKGLVVLEAQERDRCANFAIKAVAAGLAKRQVEIAEYQASMLMKALEAALISAGLQPEQRQIAKLEAVRFLQSA